MLLKLLTNWKCKDCGYENGPLRDVFCGGCGKRRDDK